MSGTVILLMTMEKDVKIMLGRGVVFVMHIILGTALSLRMKRHVRTMQLVGAVFVVSMTLTHTDAR
jgi:hypothetical protein